eukprot:CAMPEP_0173401490 /NCGR_PEP_ID=MMETSP1356-20130122/51087_1 /TAXON_ID=77927 ORGANISM="Hemiselmis virescens, Strain PCC157" /NCGR_SAMPLE_ID=MMETSP1356 /ASSEMBLY_ACC=CAM_ASM_000847 /LENGTH=187 /DNA_ID=CAMNT_0014361643 /DNA_START=93 /DNA_END=653 /DNA_ORIENTATION=+
MAEVEIAFAGDDVLGLPWDPLREQDWQSLSPDESIMSGWDNLEDDHTVPDGSHHLDNNPLMACATNDATAAAHRALHSGVVRGSPIGAESATYVWEEDDGATPISSTGMAGSGHHHNEHVSGHIDPVFHGYGGARAPGAAQTGPQVQREGAYAQQRASGGGGQPLRGSNSMAQPGALHAGPMHAAAP